MAVTGLKIVNDHGTNNMLISTVPFEEPDESGEIIIGIAVTWQAVDDTLKAVGKPEVTAHKGTEQEFHTELRERSAEMEHLIINWSSDPEWNPEGYDKKIEINGSN